MFLYIHIPFCENKCKYCRFASIWIIQEEKISKYINKLLFDINNFDKKINRLSSIYFWWWTPSILNINQLEIIINSLKNKFWFELNIEITLESTPNKITKESLIWWKNIWINRFSIWVQTLNNDSLIEIWRGNKWNIIDALKNIETSFQLSFLGEKKQEQIVISLDFIIWLPYVKVWGVKKDIEFILNNYDFVKHISVYVLEEYYYPWKWKNISIKDIEYLWEYIEVKNFLEEKWFNRYEISNFAKVWFECIHNKAYWNHSELIAFWLWAHWFINWIRFSYPDNFKSFYNLEINFEDPLNNEDIFLENIMFWLRTRWLSKEIFKKLNTKKIQEFIDSWYLKLEENLLKLEDSWVLVLDYILREII